VNKSKVRVTDIRGQRYRILESDEPIKSTDRYWLGTLSKHFEPRLVEPKWITKQVKDVYQRIESVSDIQFFRPLKMKGQGVTKDQNGNRFENCKIINVDEQSEKMITLAVDRNMEKWFQSQKSKKAMDELVKLTEDLGLYEDEFRLQTDETRKGRK
jgi:hypothetical protein